MEGVTVGMRVCVSTGLGAFTGLVAYVDLVRCDVWPESVDVREYIGGTGLHRIAGGAWRSQLTPAPAKPEGFARVTGREFQVLRLLSEGKSNREIADILGLSVFTVKTHVARLGVKLGSGDRTGIVAIALRGGMIP